MEGILVKEAELENYSEKDKREIEEAIKAFEPFSSYKEAAATLWTTKPLQPVEEYFGELLRVSEGAGDAKERIREAEDSLKNAKAVDCILLITPVVYCIL